jgi:hypothetical protein
MLLTIARLLTIGWGSIWAIVAIRRAWKGNRSSILFVYFAFYALFVLPLGADLVLGLPNYETEPGFWSASRDTTTIAAYCFVICLIPPFWLRSRNCKRFEFDNRLPYRGLVTALLVLGLSLPALLVWFAPHPQLYGTYAFIVRQRVTLDVAVFHKVMSALTVVAVLCAALLIASSRKIVLPSTIAILFSALAVWLNGKRAICAIAIVLFVLAFWYRGLLKKKTLIWALAASAFVLGIFTVSYESFARNISSDSISPEEMYNIVRIDYGRESRLQFALYAEFHSERIQILQYRGQSFFFLPTAWISRSDWPDKPYPYAVYFTAAMLGESPSPRGWGMTTSMLDESLSNCGFLGLFAGPWIVLFVCRRGDDCRDIKVSLLTVVIASLMLAVQLIAFAPLVLVWMALVLTRFFQVRGVPFLPYKLKHQMSPI